MDIQWYPGHMAKARRLMGESLKAVDMVIELLDARLPYSSRNPDFDDLFAAKARIVVLNKADLADPACTKEWIRYYKEQGTEAIAMSAVRTKEKKMLLARMQQSAEEKVQRMAKRGAKKVVRAMVTGIPNVGKSTLINSFAGRDAARTANRPGVTRGKQIIRITPYLELMDTPGVLWPKLEDAVGARNLALTGAVKDEINEYYPMARALYEVLSQRYPDALHQRYGIGATQESADHAIEALAQKRGFLLKGGVVDVERGARTLLDEFRGGILGRITLESPEDVDGRQVEAEPDF